MGQWDPATTFALGHKQHALPLPYTREPTMTYCDTTDPLQWGQQSTHWKFSKMSQMNLSPFEADSTQVFVAIMERQFITHLFPLPTTQTRVRASGVHRESSAVRWASITSCMSRMAKPLDHRSPGPTCKHPPFQERKTFIFFKSCLFIYWVSYHSLTYIVIQISWIAI